MPAGTRSIGGVLKILKDEFPDLTVTKIRFLEGEGLITPERAPSGYRRYNESDISRLHYILDVQKNHYLPLKVIREHLAAMDAGEAPPSLDAPRPADAAPAEEEESTAAFVPVPSARVATPGKRPIHITRKELLRLSGLSDAALAELERHALVVPRRGTIYFGRDALTIAVAARKLAAFGMDARHLRVMKQAAEREAALVDQAVAAHTRRGAANRQAVSDVMLLVLHAHASLLRSSIS